MMVLSDYLYRCSAGETFDLISRILYGDERYACELMHANPHYVTRAQFAGGERLAIPVLDAVEGDAEADYVSEAPPWKE